MTGYLYNGYITASTDTSGASALLVLDGNNVQTTLTEVDTNSAQAHSPVPNSWATVVYKVAPSTQTTSLGWTSGTNKFRENLYFSKDPNRVATRDPNVETASVTSPKSVGSLDLGSTYYWQIETKNTTLHLIPGQVWSFQIADYLLVDNFDDYTGVWTSSGGASSSVVSNAGLKYSPYGNSLQITVEAGQTGSVSCTPAGSDWTAKNVGALYIDVYGDSNNDANSQLRVKLNGTAAVTYPGSLQADSAGGNRVTWKIPLQNFGISMSNITTLAFEVTNPSGVNSCIVNVDEIKLVPLGCVNKPDADFDNDCRVYLDDLEIMANNWLQSGLGFPQ